ncbi:MAG: DUF3422 domain-containing protein [Pseudomonadota bacterium]
MSERTLDHHPKRFAMTNELHARPFMPVAAPGRALVMAFKQTNNAQERDPALDRRHLLAFIDRHGGQHPAPGASHYLATFGRFTMKWERHTEFVSYTLVEEGGGEALFDSALAEHLPPDWLAEAPGQVVAASEIEVLRVADRAAAEKALTGPLSREFSAESLAAALTLDDGALAIGDFRIHEGGFSRFALVVYGPVGDRRIGRAMQRLVEIENYRMLAMLALPIARDAAARLNEIDRELSRLIATVADREDPREEAEILDALTALSAEIEAMSATTAFRFGAARAYEAIVHERIAMMREERMIGRQLFSEFMLRRFDPAMRTVRATSGRLTDLATRAGRIADLLRTRVDVALQAQNQQLLTSMDKRAALQLRLQQTVEGLSVVAISYYAVSLAGYFIAPLGQVFGVTKEGLTALTAIPIVAAVALFVRRIRRGVEKAER